MKTSSTIIKLIITSLLYNLSYVQQASADLSGTIPSTALSVDKKKVTICHFPPGNPANYQVITISKSALNTHIDHHDDVFANTGVCPPIPKAWPTVGSYNASTGKPLAVTTFGCTMPSNIVNKVLTLLPEGKALSSSSPLLTTDSKANIVLTKTANIKVAFVTEGAGYTNSLGYFSFAKTDLATLDTSKIQEKIIFPNFSMKNSGGDLSMGDAVDLGSFTAGTGVGFTILSNGWKSNAIDPNRTVNQIFRTVKGMNPETSGSSLQYHTVLLSDPDSKTLVLGIEDLNRYKNTYNDYSYTSDNDFNDAVLAVCVDPYDAIEGVTTLNTLNTGTPTETTTSTTTTTGSTTTTSTTGSSTTTTPAAAAPATMTGVSGRQSWSERNVAPAPVTTTTNGGAAVTTTP